MIIKLGIVILSITKYENTHFQISLKLICNDEDEPIIPDYHLNTEVKNYKINFKYGNLKYELESIKNKIKELLNVA